MKKRKFIETPIDWCLWTLVWVLIGVAVTIYKLKVC